jgi:hypothetical protein
VVVEAASADCGCVAPGHAPLSADVVHAVHNKGVWANDCLCELLPASGSARDECLNDATLDPSGVGWCWIDPSNGVGNAALIAGCPPPPQYRTLFRVFDPAGASRGYAVVRPVAGTVESRPLGAVCVPEDETQSQFSGYSITEVNYQDWGTTCASDLCLVNHFQGRVSCPYGQPADRDAASERCYVPGSDVLVTVPVPPQLTGRRPEIATTCSCKCGGIGPGPFCACPTGLECVEVQRPVMPADAGDFTFDLIHETDLYYSGSYCIPAGAGPVPVDAASLGEACADGKCGVPRPY